jgi:phasin family protein
MIGLKVHEIRRQWTGAISGGSAMTAKTSAARKFAAHHNEDVKRTAVHHNEDVKRAIEKVTVAGEEATRRMEDIYSKVTQETIEFQQRLLATTHANVDAAFECARELLGVTSPSEFMEVSTKHARQQFEAVRQQTKELAEIAQKTAIESMGPFATGLGGTLLGRPDHS